jgi:hypothetical protein
MRHRGAAAVAAVAVLFAAGDAIPGVVICFN